MVVLLAVVNPHRVFSIIQLSASGFIQLSPKKENMKSRKLTVTTFNSHHEPAKTLVVDIEL